MGTIMTQENIEGRKSVGKEQYTGTVAIWVNTGGWGLIDIPEQTPLPAEVKAKIKQMQEDAKAKGKEAQNPNAIYFRFSDVTKGFRVQKEAQVTFNIYIDEKGAGAMNVNGVGDAAVIPSM